MKEESKRYELRAVRPQVITDSVGEELVVLPRKEFTALLEILEDYEDALLYKKTMEEDDGERIPMEEAFKIIEEKRK